MKNKYRSLFSLAAAALLAAVCLFGITGLAGCKNDDPVSPPTPQITVSLSASALTIEENGEAVLEAVCSTGETVRWETSNNAVASVSSAGRVLAKKQGSAAIRATAGDAFAECTVTVVPVSESGGAALCVAEKELLLSLQNGAPAQIEAGYTVGGREEETAFTYSSENNAIATVSAEGEVTPVALGTTRVRVQAQSLVAYVTVDVYTDGISTPQEWLSMFSEQASDQNPALTERYFLENDIDFTGVAYDIGRIADAGNEITVNGETVANHYCFNSEVNGNLHTVKNITVWPEYDAEINPEDYQSVFGRAVGALVHDIVFENVVFDSVHSSGLASVTFHNTSNAGAVQNTVFENISADFVYALQAPGADASDAEKSLYAQSSRIATGFAFRTYGVEANNLFIHMRTPQGVRFADHYHNVCGFAWEEWIWYGGSVTQTVAYAEGAEDVPSYFIQGGDPVYKLAKDGVRLTEGIIETAYYTQLYLDGAVWNFDKDGIPVLKK